MAADFNAGSIEGTLGLDTAPFTAGLRKAQMQAREFENKKIAPKADLDAKEFEAKKKSVKIDLDRLDHEKVKPKADLDISSVLAKSAILNKLLDAGGLGKASINPAMLIGKFTLLAGGVMSVAAALGPLTAAVTGFGGAAVVAFTGAAVSVGLFAKAVTSDFAKIQEANKKGLALSGPAGDAQKALKRVGNAWDALLKKTSQPVFGVMTKAFNGAASILPKLAPLLNTTAKGIGGVVDRVVALTKTPLFDRFLKQLQQFMGSFLNGFGPLLVTWLRTFMNLFIGLQPVIHMIGQGLKQFGAWAQEASASLAHGGIKPFIAYLHEWLPRIGNLFHALFNAMGSIGRGIAPLARPAMAFLTTLLNTIGRINFEPFAQGFRSVLHAARPLLPVIGAILNTVLVPFGQLLRSLARNVITPLADSLGSRLQPALKDLRSIFHSLIGPLSAFLGSIANLVNPTGVSFLSALLHILAGVVKRLAKPFGDLLVALESVIDTGIKAITPLLPGLEDGFNGAADAVGGFVGWLARLISHKGVALTILGIAAAIKAVRVAMAVANAVSATYAAIQGTIIALSYGAEGATYAQGAALVAYTVITRTVSAVTKAWAAAQWLLNFAMDANPIGLVILAIAALIGFLVLAWQHSDSFREHVKKMWSDIKSAASAAWDFLKGIFKMWVDVWFAVVGALLHGAAKAFGWVPGLGGKLKAAASNFDAFRDRVNNSLSGIHDKHVTVTATFLQRGSPTVAAMMHNPSLNKPSADVSLNMGPHRATGGPVAKGKGYVVGEHGPEWFEPDQNGTILPNHITMRKAHSDSLSNGDSPKVVALLTAIANHLAAKDGDHEGLADALGKALSKHSEATMRKMVQIARAT